jgi:hypothetical protein
METTIIRGLHEGAPFYNFFIMKVLRTFREKSMKFCPLQPPLADFVILRECIHCYVYY